MPPLSRHSLEADPGFDSCLLALLEAVDLAAAPEAASCGPRQAFARPPGLDRLDLALQVFEGALPVDRIAECVFVSAALQVRLAEQAARAGDQGSEAGGGTVSARVAAERRSRVSWLPGLRPTRPGN